MYLVDHLPEDVTEDFLINSFTDLQDEIDDTVKKFKQMLKETNQHTDPVEPSQIQQPSSHNQLTSHDNLPPTSALPHLPDSLGNQLTHQNTSSSQQPTVSNPPQISTLPMSQPKIKNDPFTGDPMKWNTWHGLFTTMIDKQPLSVAEKMTHLQTLTTGKAHEAMTSPLTSTTQMPSRRIIFCSGEHTSMCHLDISTTSESLTAEDGSTHNKLQIMFGSAWSRNTYRHFYQDKNGSSAQHLWKLAKQFGSSKISHREVFGQLEESQLSTTTTHSHVSTKSRQKPELSQFQQFAWHQ